MTVYFYGNDEWIEGCRAKIVIPLGIFRQESSQSRWTTKKSVFVYSLLHFVGLPWQFTWVVLAYVLVSKIAYLKLHFYWNNSSFFPVNTNPYFLPPAIFGLDSITGFMDRVLVVSTSAHTFISCCLFLLTFATLILFLHFSPRRANNWTPTLRRT